MVSGDVRGVSLGLVLVDETLPPGEVGLDVLRAAVPFPEVFLASFTKTIWATNGGSTGSIDCLTFFDAPAFRFLWPALFLLADGSFVFSSFLAIVFVGHSAARWPC